MLPRLELVGVRGANAVVDRHALTKQQKAVQRQAVAAPELRVRWQFEEAAQW